MKRGITFEIVTWNNQFIEQFTAYIAIFKLILAQDYIYVFVTYIECENKIHLCCFALSALYRLYCYLERLMMEVSVIAAEPLLYYVSNRM